MRQSSKEQEDEIRRLLPKKCSYDLYEEIDQLVPELNIKNIKSLEQILSKVKQLESDYIITK